MMQATNPEKGILIIAQGKQRYIDMARTISMSIKLSNPDLQLALVTDTTDERLKAYYHYIIPVDPSFGTGFSQKMRMYEYSPFQKTLFIDVDCMVIKNIDFLWALFEGQQMSVMGKKLFSGPYIGTTIELLRSNYTFEYLPSFNGGVYFFEKSKMASEVFALAQDIFNNRYDELKLWKFDGRRGDEPAMAIAMGVHGVIPVDDQKKGMYTPMGQQGVFKMDVLKGFCEFYKNGEKVMPAIMHFGGGYPEAFHYRRERMKIELVYRFKLPKIIVSFLVNALYNPIYISYVFVYRLLKSIVKREKMKFTPWMPMFRFE
jgi:hypothetical protein